MLPPPDTATVRRPRGTEPLRRKRVQTVTGIGSRRRRMLNMLLVFATAVLLVDALVGEKGFMERMRAKREYTQAAARLNAIRIENAALREQVRRLRDDPAAIETIAREELGLIRTGVLMFSVRDARPVSR